MARVINSKIWVRFIIPIFILIGLLHTALASGNDISEFRERILSFDFKHGIALMIPSVIEAN